MGKQREIKFRGMRIDNGEWISGCYIFDPSSDKSFIGMGWLPQQGWDVYEIVPETVEQYTGKKDKNGKEIYEGNIVKWNREKYALHKEVNAEIVWKDFGWHLKCKEFGDLYFTVHNMVEVIGDIHGNPHCIGD